MRREFIMLLWLIGFFGCFSARAQKHPDLPNILWITTEDIDPAWGCYGDEYAWTPNIDKLAAKGHIFTQAFSNSPICAPARSSLITGMYATSLGTQHLRSEVPLPDDLKILPELLREQGYYTANNVKTDYNFSPEGRWDDSSQKAHWKNRPAGKPFFSVFNFTITHEGPTNNFNREQITHGLSQKHDPAKVDLPPYFPDSPEMRRIMAHQYDLITIFDQEVGKLMAQLKEDGLYENTIIFVFSDHGFGLPRHKRWLNNSGLQVPFVLYVPEKYKHLATELTEQKVTDMVGFVDFAPTVLALAGLQASPYMEGINFLGANRQRNEFIYGFRSRADDCYDMSRSVYDGRYLYIRHYMPQMPYFQEAVIFNTDKSSMAELLNQREKGMLPASMEQYFHPKPVVELYDLADDPFELTNLAEEPAHQGRMAELQIHLDQWMIKHKDSGMLNEAEYMESALGSSVYEIMRASENFDPAKVVKVMNRVGKSDNLDEIRSFLESNDPSIRYWGLMALEVYGKGFEKVQPQLVALLSDSSAINAIFSARLLIQNLDYQRAYATLKKHLDAEDEPTVLHAAIAVRLLDKKAEPLISAIKNEIFPKYEGEVWNRYKSWSYPMFIGMALDQVRINCGEEILINK